MKLIGKGLLISVLFVLLLVSVKAEFDPVFYNDIFWDNYPYGKHQFQYYTCDVSITNFCIDFPSGWDYRGDTSIGNVFASDSGFRGWDSKYIAGFCMAGTYQEEPTDHEGDCSGTYYARATFMGYSASNKNMNIKYRVDDDFVVTVYELVGTTETQRHTANFPITSGPDWSSGTIPLTKGWNKIVIKYKDTGGKDWMRIQVVNETGDAVNNHYPFVAVVPPSKYIEWSPLITATEDICNDFRDNDGDWIYDYDGVNVTWYNHTKYFTTRGYLARDDNYPNFGERNVDCFDQDCIGKLGPMDHKGNVGLCGYDKEIDCNDGYDNDFDGLTDSEDVDDCTPTGVDCTLRSSIMGEPWYNPSASDGSDGCCGDDPNGDYGYVTPDNYSLCYNYKYAFKGQSDTWDWIDAPEKPFIITPVNFSLTGQHFNIDYISNSENWYFCDATQQIGNGIPIPEYGSFPSPTTGGLSAMNCSAAVGMILNAEVHGCEGNDSPLCCMEDTVINVLENQNAVKECYCILNSGQQTTEQFCELMPDHPFCKDTLNMGSEELLKEYCQRNERNCFNQILFHNDSVCEGNPNNGEKCTPTEVCVDGISLNASDGACCMGEEKHCEDASDMDESKCGLLGGDYYQKNEATSCLPPEQDIPIGEDAGCCFGILVNKNSFYFSSFQEINNNSFSCFAYQTGGYFGQCCYDQCDNFMNIVPDTSTKILDQARNRIFSLGSVYGYVRTYDEYNGDPLISRFEDKLRRKSGINNNISLDVSISMGGKPNLTYFEYLEFDVLYNSPHVGNIFINDVNMGPLKQHISGGDKELIPHHVKIWIRTPELQHQTLNSVKIEVRGTEAVEIGYDNLFLTTDYPSVRFASERQYCTGGFTSWISDLDPTINDPNNEFFIGPEAYMNGYGRYAVTCNQQWPYGWTGHYCCGDDSTALNYGEHYSDVGVPTWAEFGGCFNGTPVFNEEAVWKKRGYVEYRAFWDPQDSIKDYYYKDLIYSGDTFVSCQTPSSKYTNLRESYDGETIESGLLVNTNENNQCAVVGKYYCIDNSWRQYIPGMGQTYSFVKNEYVPSIPSTLELKSVPPATNLIKNSNFGGDCPPAICPIGGGNTGQ